VGHGAGLEHAHSVELAPLEEALVERRRLARRRHAVRRRHDAGEEAGIVADLDRFLELDAEGLAQHGGHRRGHARSGHRVHCNEVEVFRAHSVAHPAHAERLEDVLLQHVSDVVARRAPDDLAQHEPSGHRVVGEQASGPRSQLRIAQDLDDAFGLRQQVEVEILRRKVRDSGAVRQKVPDRDAFLAVARKLGNEVADAVLHVQDVLLVELVDHEKRLNGVPVVTSCFSPSGGSPGAFPRAWPIVRCNTTWPWRRMQTWSPG
jgi:hypothetical protein